MQKPNPNLRSEVGKRISSQVNREAPKSNAGTIPQRISDPGAITTPNTTTPPISMPMDRATPPSTSMPMDRTTPRTGMPTNGTIPRTRMPMNGVPMNGAIPPARMPMNNGMNSGASVPINNLYMPNNIPYNTPVGVPLFPLYGYDNCEDIERDMNYFDQLYPNSARRIQREINNECDQLEYDGSVMFDEYPDKVTLDRIIDRVYENIKDMDKEAQVETNSIYRTPVRRQNLLRDFVSIILINELLNRRRRYRGRRRWF